MKMAVWKKLPAEMREVATELWHMVYVTMELDRDETKQFVSGMLSGARMAGLITNEERQELFRYYAKWFSL